MEKYRSKEVKVKRFWFAQESQSNKGNEAKDIDKSRMASSVQTQFDGILDAGKALKMKKIFKNFSNLLKKTCKKGF